MSNKKVFEIKCTTTIFTKGEIADLQRHGHFMQGLKDGRIALTTEKQKQFLKNTAENAMPVTYWECLWAKYEARVDAEKIRNSIPRYAHIDKSEEWYSIKDWKNGVHFPRKGR